MQINLATQLYLTDNDDTYPLAVYRFDGTTGAYIDTFIPSGSGGLAGTTGIDFGPDGNFYVASWLNGKVFKYNGISGAFLGEFAAGLEGPYDLDFGPDGMFSLNGFHELTLSQGSNRCPSIGCQFLLFTRERVILAIGSNK